MLKDFFNRPASPFHDQNEPTFLSIGNVLAIAGYTAVIIGGAFAAVEIIDHVRPEASSVVKPATTGALQYPQPFVQKVLG